MKNLYMLPNSQQSKKGDIVVWNGLKIWDGIGNTPHHNQNIYITNSEEIKDQDWCLDKFSQKWKLENNKLIAFDIKGIKRFSTDNISGHDCKKIILTTDTKLIKDGVQAIDDTFLEWFVKNPSCDQVDVNTK